MGVIFGSWPESLHSEFEQVKRIEAGRKLKKKVVSFNPDEQTMVIAGSAADPYFGRWDDEVLFLRTKIRIF